MAEASARLRLDLAVLSAFPGCTGHPFGSRPVDFCLVAAFLVGLAACVVAIDRLPADYDEVYHAHGSWLIAQGGRPYHDSLAVHTPYAWYAVASLTPWLPDSPRMLLPLRISTGIGTLIWMVALIANFGCRSNLSLRWMLAAFGVVLFSTPVLAYTVEFRPDSWAFALYFAALFGLRRGCSTSVGFRQYACYSCLASAATVACLKVAPFALMFACFDLLRLARRGPDLRNALLGHVSGALLTLAISWLLLKWMHVDLQQMLQFSWNYQRVYESQTGFSYGLLQSLISNRLPLLVGCAGILSWGVHLIRARKIPDPLEASIVAVLFWELFEVHRPYKQYYGPWLLTATPFFAYVGPFCRLRGLREGVLGSAVAIAGVTAAASVVRLRANEYGPALQRFQEQIAALSEEDSTIIAAPPFHPIIRRDVFYAWSRTTDPHGYGTERVLNDLGCGDLVSAERDRDEMRRSDPSLIVLPLPGEDLYEPIQWQIISEFLRNNRERYEILDGSIRPIAVRREPPPARKKFENRGTRQEDRPGL